MSEFLQKWFLNAPTYCWAVGFLMGAGVALIGVDVLREFDLSTFTVGGICVLLGLAGWIYWQVTE